MFQLVNGRCLWPSLSRFPYVIQGTHRGYIGVEVDVHKAVSGTSPRLQAEGSKCSPSFQAKIKSLLENRNLMKHMNIECSLEMFRSFGNFWIYAVESTTSNWPNFGQSLGAPNFLNAATSTSKPQLVRWFTWTEPSTCKTHKAFNFRRFFGEFVDWWDVMGSLQRIWGSQPTTSARRQRHYGACQSSACSTMEKYVNASTVVNISTSQIVVWRWLNHLMTVTMIVQWHNMI